MRARRSRRSTASRRPGRLRSTASADARLVLSVHTGRKCPAGTDKSAMTLRFGTDGVRGVANLDLTPELVTAFGRAAARVLGGDEFVIGRDTRVSGPLLEVALAAGLASEGLVVSTLGVVPTPAIAWTAAHRGVAGAMISASHNKYPDNGVKLFAPGGRKLRDDIEGELEAELDRLVHQGNDASRSPTGDAVGTIAAA